MPKIDLVSHQRTQNPKNVRDNRGPGDGPRRKYASFSISFITNAGRWVKSDPLNLKIASNEQKPRAGRPMIVSCAERAEYRCGSRSS